jgi:hypothetical protein
MRAVGSQDAIRLVPDHRFDQIVLVVEVVIQLGLPDAGGDAYLVEGRSPGAVDQHQPSRLLHDPLTGTATFGTRRLRPPGGTPTC